MFKVKKTTTYVRKFKQYCDICGEEVDNMFSYGTFINTHGRYIRLTQSTENGMQEQMSLCGQCGGKLFLFLNKLYDKEPTGLKSIVANLNNLEEPTIVDDEKV